jgi:ATP-binding cassette subfamily B protein
MRHGGGWWSFISYDESKGRAKIDRTLIRRVWGYARPYLGKIGFILGAITVSSVIELIPPLLYRDLFDNVLPNKDYSRLNWLGLGMLAVPIISNLIGVAERYFSARVGEGIIYDLRQGMYEHLQRMSLRFFTQTKSGEIISRFNNDVVGAQSAVTSTVPSIVTSGVTLLTTLAVMLSIEWRLTLMSMAVLPLFLLPARRVGAIFREIRRDAMEHNADMSSIISESLSINGALLAKSFGRLKQERERYRTANEKVRDIGIRRALVGRWFFMGLGIASTIGMVLIYWGGGYMVLEGTITAGTIVAFVAYLGRLYGPISSLSNVQVEFATSMVSFERVFEYLDQEIEIKNKANAIELSAAKGQIDFEQVGFAYAEPDRNNNVRIKSNGKGHSAHVEKDIEEIAERRSALEDISFSIEPGQLVALVGPSGAGKTTISYLLPRLYDPSSGSIRLDGHDLRDLELNSLAKQIGMVTQESYLFHDSIRANLIYARPEASDIELDQATQAANIGDFIASLPEGYDTMVGERGYRLSGGEKQRLAIARVILKDPRILVLDEATAHLDSQSEALIQGALEPLMKGRTSIVIAHRLSTILAADKILVLEQGRLVEEGQHDELLAKSGLYASLYETQFSQHPMAIK